MTYKWKCNLCNQEFKCNGWIKQNDINREHLREKHEKEQKILLNLRKEVKRSEDKVRDYDKVLFTDL